MKKLIGLGVAALLALSLSACTTVTATPASTKSQGSVDKPSASAPAVEVTTEATPEAAPAPQYTASQQSAIDKANNYLQFMAFSRQGLIDQLVFEQFSTEDATFAVDTINPDYNVLAQTKAQQYQDTIGGFSHGSLVDQLTFEGFTPEQAEFGVTAIGL